MRVRSASSRIPARHAVLVHMAHAMKRHIAGGGAAMVAMIAFGLVQPMPQVARADYTEADARRALEAEEATLAATGAAVPAASRAAFDAAAVARSAAASAAAASSRPTSAASRASVWVASCSRSTSRRRAS